MMTLDQCLADMVVHEASDIFITVGVIFMIFCELIGINDQYEKN